MNMSYRDDKILGMVGQMEVGLPNTSMKKIGFVRKTFRRCPLKIFRQIGHRKGLFSVEYVEWFYYSSEHEKKNHC